MITMNEKLYREAMEGSKPVLIEYWAPWCVYCRRITPALEKISQQYAGKQIGRAHV